MFEKFNKALLLLSLLCAPLLYAPLLRAQIGTFGEVTSFGETPSDVLLDESRGRAYFVRTAANRVEVYDYLNKSLLNPIQVGLGPVSAALSPDNETLYVTNSNSSSVSVIRVASNEITGTIALPAKPEGIAVGADGRVLITTQGTGLNNALQTLLLYDPSLDPALQLATVSSPATISTAGINQNVTAGARPAVFFPGKLIATPDRNFIVGMVAINQTLNSAQTTMFVYEAASGTVLRARTVNGQSTVLAMSPDASRYMAGAAQYDFTTLNQYALMNTANLPFALVNSGFPAAVNYGGSVFAPDGKTIYSAFNYTATTATARATSNVLFIGNPQNLGVRLGIRLPESVLGRMVITADGATILALSESGFISLPIGNLFDYPILDTETTQVFLASDPCNKGIARATLKISNLGAGKLTFIAPNPGTSVIAEVKSGLAPSSITFTMDPGRVNINRRPGTNVFTNNNGQPIVFNLASTEAINIPNTIRIYMNYRQADQRGIVFPVPTLTAGTGPARGLRDIVLDEPRNRLYISNSAFNRIEIFDTLAQRFLDPVDVGQFPQSMEKSLDGKTLYIANVGGESLMMLDLDSLLITGSIEFPPTPRNVTGPILAVDAMAMTLSGLQFTTVLTNNTGNVWRTLGNQAVIRPGGGIFNAAGTVGANRFMTASPGGESAMLLAGNAPSTAYLYDAALDTYTASRSAFLTAYAGYVAPLAAAPRAEYFLAGGQVLSSALTPIAGAERPAIAAGAASNRNVFAALPVDSDTYLRVTTPVRATAVTVTRDDERALLELVNIRSQNATVLAILPENPAFFVSGAATAVSVPARQMAASSRGVVYILTLSGLTVVPTTPSTTATQPAVAAQPRGIVNANDGGPTLRAGSFVAINGVSLATTTSAGTIPLPTVLGGSCVTFNDIALPILSASPTQIVAQIPADVRPGVNIVQVRSLLNAQQSTPVLVTVSK